jgi:hypothetical protein
MVLFGGICHSLGEWKYIEIEIVKSLTKIVLIIG